MKKWIITLLLVALCGMAQAKAVFSFAVFTTNGVYGNAPGLNLWAEIFNSGNGTTFRFHNDSTFDCSIAKIYFDDAADGSLFSISSLSNGLGTAFGTGQIRPGNLPGGANLDPAFVANSKFNIGTIASSPINGINSGEWASVTFALSSGRTLQDVLNELASGELRVGIHVQAFPDGWSESAIMIPEPASAMLVFFGAGVGVVIHRARRSAMRR